MGAPQARISALADELGRLGAAVTIHTCFPHYPDGTIEPPYRLRPYLRETEGPVDVVRTAVYPTPNRGFLRRLANHTSFALSALAGAPWSGRADVVVVESPPLFLAGAAIAYARGKRARLVVNVADRWPASAVELGALRNEWAIRAATALELGCYHAADAITVPTAGLHTALSELPEARGKVHRLGPGVDAGLLRAASAPRGEPLRVLYAGTIGLAQGLATLVEAARIAGPATVHVEIAGDGAEAPAIRAQVERQRIDNVRILGRVPREQIPGLYARAHAAAVLLLDRPIFEAALPTKILEAMAAGRAVVLSAQGEAARLVSEAGAGIIVPPEDPPALAAAFSELASDPGRRERLGAAGRRFAVPRFDYGRVAADWLSLLQALA